MPRQFYSDKYIKNMRGAGNAEDDRMRDKAVAEQTESLKREKEIKYAKEEKIKTINIAKKATKNEE